MRKMNPPIVKVNLISVEILKSFIGVSKVTNKLLSEDFGVDVY